MKGGICLQVTSFRREEHNGVADGGDIVPEPEHGLGGESLLAVDRGHVEGRGFSIQDRAWNHGDINSLVAKDSLERPAFTITP